MNPRLLLLSLLGLVLMSACSDSERPHEVPVSPSSLPDPVAVTPVDLRVTEVGDIYLELAWDDTSGQEAGYLLQTRSGADEDYVLLARLDPGVDEWEMEVEPDSTYAFQIAAFTSSSISDWSDPVQATALRAGYWEVTPGIFNQSCWGPYVSFSFGRANRYYSGGGTLTIEGPPEWNGGQDFVRVWHTYYIGCTGAGIASGDYHLTLDRGDRQHTATVTIDATMVLPLPEVTLDILPDRRVHASWSCEQADRYGLCWGPANEAGCHSVGTCTDTILVADEIDPINWLDVSASRDPINGQRSSSARGFTINWETEKVAPVKGQRGVVPGW